MSKAKNIPWIISFLVGIVTVLSPVVYGVWIVASLNTKIQLQDQKIDVLSDKISEKKAHDDEQDADLAKQNDTLFEIKRLMEKCDDFKS